MSDIDNSNYETFRWLEDVQLLEPVDFDELNEIEKIARVVEEISLEHTELYTTS